MLQVRTGLLLVQWRYSGDRRALAGAWPTERAKIDLGAAIDTGGVITTLNVPGATETFAYGINDAGQRVGSYDDSNFNGHGFLYSGGTFLSFDVSPGSGTIAHGINNAGQIVGYYGGFEGFVATPTAMSVPEASSLALLGTGLLGLLSIGGVRRRREQAARVTRS